MCKDRADLLLYPPCVLHVIEILPNRVRMGSPWPFAGAKAPSKTLIVLAQSCKRIRGSQSGLKKKQLTSCSLWQMSSGRFLHLSPTATHPPSPPPSPIPSHPTLSVLLSWERAARGDPGLLNLLPKTLLLKWVRMCICVRVYLYSCIRINSQYSSERLYLCL